MERTLIVQKYGGSSLAQPEQIQNAAARIVNLYKQGYSLLIIVSAMGKTTDQLVELAYKVSPTPNRRELDMLLTTGERISMALMSMALNDAGCSAISFTGSQAGVFTDESHSNARIVDIKPIRVDAEIAKGRIVVLAGFQGVSPKSKEVTTLGRGGTDTTAVAMAAYFRAERCEIRKDVDGVYSADPNQVKNAEHLDSLHYHQLLNMTFWGAKVLHYRSVELATLLGIPLVITLAHTDGRKTVISSEANMYEQARILSVNSHKDVRWLVVIKTDLNNALGELKGFLQTQSLPWPQILDSEKRDGHWAFLITCPLETLTAIGTLSRKGATLRLENHELSSVTATCQGSFASTLPEEISSALVNRNITPQKMMFSAMNISVLLEARDREKAVQIIHDLRASES